MKNKNVIDQEVLEVIRIEYTNIFPAEKKVADVVLSRAQDVVNYNVSELAKASGVSDATIVRMCHHLGYSGYYQFRIALARDLGKKQHKEVQKDKHLDIISQQMEEYSETMIAIGKRLDAKKVAQCVELIKNASCVHLIAMGNTTNLAKYMGFRLERLGVRSTYSDMPEYYTNHINLAEEGDVVFAISKSGTSKRVINAMELAKGKNLKLIALTACITSPVAELADCVLISSGRQEPFNIYKGYSYLNEFVIIDMLLNFVVNEELIEVTKADVPELLLAENKL